MTVHTVAECLATIGVTAELLAGCESLHAEFQKIKRCYFAKVLVVHPDKGGDAASFRTLQTAFESVRELFSNHKVGSFADCVQSTQAAEHYDDIYHGFETAPGGVPSYEYYYEAAMEEVPLYRCELAKANRSQCKKCIANKKKEAKKKQKEAQEADMNEEETALSAFAAPPKKTVDPGCAIAKGDVRFGSLDDMSGTYGRWHHVTCWRVPAKVWRGLPEPGTGTLDDVIQALIGMNEVLLSGFDDLERSDQEICAQHIGNKENWARATKKKSNKEPLRMPEVAAAAAAGGGAAMLVQRPTSTAVVAAKKRFVLLRPGVDGAADSLAGKTFVLTGIFPEIGGGAGLNLGKAKLKAMIESFGGRVTSAVSGKTDFVISGKEPGMSKVSQARERGVGLMDVDGLQNAIKGQCALEQAPEPVIRSFSSGYGSNGLALLASQEHIAYAKGKSVLNADAEPWEPPTAAAYQKPKKKSSKAAKAAPEVVDLCGDDEKLDQKMPAKKAPPSTSANADSNAIVPAATGAKAKKKKAPPKKTARKTKKPNKKAAKSHAAAVDVDGEENSGGGNNAVVPGNNETKRPPTRKKRAAQTTIVAVPTRRSKRQRK